MSRRELPPLILPADTGAPPHSAFLRNLLVVLGSYLRGLADRLTGPFHLATYTAATRPAAASFPGALIYVSDAAANQKLQYSDGSSWVVAG